MTPQQEEYTAGLRNNIQKRQAISKKILLRL